MPTMDGLRGQLAHSSRIAAALLEVLAESGDVGARARALRAIGADGAMLRSGVSWVNGPRLADMMRAAEVDRRLARRVGQALVRPDGVGLALCYSGLATPEKAFRRSHHLLARESEDAHYEPQKIDAQRGRILFHPAPDDDGSRPDDATGRVLCGVREGMLEAIPLLFGLVPARVRERRCAYDGADTCVFEVSWTRTPRIGLLAGLLAGTLIGAAMVVFGPGWGLPFWPLAGAAPCVAILCGAAGRSIDLARQLEAVAGARRGQLALLDQLDSSLAERMDALAKIGATPDTAGEDSRSEAIQGLVPVARDVASQPGFDRGGAADASTRGARTAILDAARGLRDELAQLHDRIARDDAVVDHVLRARVRSCAAHGRHIEAAAGELERQLAQGESRRDLCEPGTLIGRALDALRPELSPEVRIETDLEGHVPSILCDAFQIEHVVEQLLRNAVEAVGGAGTLRLSLAASPGGVEIAVEDDGEGIEHDTVDEVFDPFVEPRSARQPGGLGLPVCYRIVEEHGGELHVRSSEQNGTRVSFVLPAG